MRPDDDAILTVSALTTEVQGLLGTTFDDVWVRGEISQPRTPASGHVYLTLKDEGAVLPCVVWRSTAARLRVAPEEGQEVLVRGRIDVYPPHGRYQLVVRTIEPVGAGALQLAFERMRRKLEAEGLFDAEGKQPLPFLPRRIALITSRTGAAVRDMVTVIRRRFPCVDVLLDPVRVQGDGAAQEIARAIERVDTRVGADVIIVGRGGGSLEDLWAFNEEIVARAIARCATPVVSAVGHETDVTIADWVADVRAATPSQAAELVVPVRDDLLRQLDSEARRLRVQMQRRLGRDRDGLEHLRRRLTAHSPGAALRRRAEALGGLRARLLPPLRRRLRDERERVRRAAIRATRSAVTQLRGADTRCTSLRHRLRALSPLAVLGRGYSLTTLEESGRVVRAASDVRIGDALRTRVSSGDHVTSRVERIEPGEDGA